MKELIRPKTYLFNLATMLLFKGKMFKEDVLLLANKITKDKTSASRLFRELVKRNVFKVEEIEIGKRNKKQVIPVVSLTEQGENILLSYYHFPRPSYENVVRRFNISSTDSLLRLLNSNHIKTMFNCAGIQTDANFKPSLMQLYCRVRGIAYNDQDDRYPLMADTEVDDLLDKGIFYDDFEYREFYRYISNETIAVKSSFRGVFIQADKCCVVYSNGKNNYHMVYIHELKNEYKLIDSLLKCRFAFPNNLFAITISDGEGFIYATASGRVAGKEKKNKAIPKTLLTAHSKLLDKSQYMYLNDIISVVYGEQGVKHLQYIVNNNQRSYRAKKMGIANISKDFTSNIDEDGVLRYYRDRFSVPCYYLPVYSIRTLVEIRELNYDPIILCEPDMVKVIARTTRRELTYIDINSLQILNKEDLLIYDEQGYPKGKKMLEDYLHSLNLDASIDQFNNLPKLYNLEYVDFYNQIAEGNIEVQDLLSHITTKPYVPYKKSRRSTQVIRVETDTYNIIKECALKNNISMYLMVKRVFNEYVKNENSKGVDIVKEQT